MTKPVIVTRAAKGSPLTRTELDSNFSNLDDATLTVAADTGYIERSLNGTFNIIGGSGITTSIVNNKLIISYDPMQDGGDSTGLFAILDGGDSQMTSTGTVDGGYSTT